MDRRREWVAGLVAAVALAFYLWWEIAHRAIFAYTTSIYPLDPADEWRYTACSTLVARGYALFDQVFSAQPPLLFLSLAGSIQVFGATVEGARWAEIAYGLLALLSVRWLTRQLAGSGIAAVAALLLAISPGFLAYAHTIEAEGPMLALLALALALAARAGRASRPTFWAALAGVALAASVLVKLFALEGLAPAIWLLAVPLGIRTRQFLWSLSSLALGLFVPLALDFGLLSPPSQWQQVVTMHDRAASLALPDALSNGRILTDFFTLDFGLTILAAAGLLFLLAARAWYPFGLAVLWLGGTTAMLALFHPLFPHHAAILTAPLAVTAGLGLGALLTVLPSPAPSLVRMSGVSPGSLPWWQEWRERRTGEMSAPPVRYLLAMPLLAYLAFLPGLAHDDRHLLAAAPPPSASPLAHWIVRHSSGRRTIVVDDISLAIGADRLVPPPLCDPSTVRFLSGFLTTGQLIAATSAYHAQLVLPTAVYLQAPGYIEWLRQHYRPVRVAPGLTAYLAK